jgi:hypothetical protein
MNSTLQSINSGYDGIRLNDPPWGSVGEIQAIPGRFSAWEAELRWDFWWGFSLGIAISAPTQYSGSSFLTFSIMNNALNQTINHTYTSNIEVSPPLMLTLHRSINVIRNLNVSIDGGIGLYRAQMTQTHLFHARYPLEDITLFTSSFDVSGSELGYRLGASVEYRFNQRFSMIAEGQWRFAKISTLTGIQTGETQTFDADGNLTAISSTSKEGILYHYFGEDFETGEFREKLVVDDFPPPWVGIDLPHDVRNASLNLGGFTLKIGLRIRLF